MPRDLARRDDEEDEGDAEHRRRKIEQATPPRRRVTNARSASPIERDRRASKRRRPRERAHEAVPTHSSRHEDVMPNSPSPARPRAAARRPSRRTRGRRPRDRRDDERPATLTAGSAPSGRGAATTARTGASATTPVWCAVRASGTRRAAIASGATVPRSTKRIAHAATPVASSAVTGSGRIAMSQASRAHEERARECPQRRVPATR